MRLKSACCTVNAVIPLCVSVSQKKAQRNSSISLEGLESDDDQVNNYLMLPYHQLALNQFSKSML